MGEAEWDAAEAAVERVRAIHASEGWPLYGGGESKEYWRGADDAIKHAINKMRARAEAYRKEKDK